MKKNQGQSLVEVLVALGISVLVILALAHVTTIAIKNATFSRNQAQATKYAQEAMEWLRSERDKKWIDFANRADVDGRTYCFNSLAWTNGSCSTFGLEGSFKREAVLTKESDEQIKADVTVSWQDGEQIHKSKLSSYFTKW